MNGVSISSSDLGATIAPLGAELQTLTTADGRDLQWNGDPTVWRGRAPVLFPIVGMLAGGTYRLGGKTYAMPKHGFARTSLFEIGEVSGDSASFLLRPSDQTRAVYPFEFLLTMSFALSGATLTCSATIANHGDAPMPASFGFHPALRWPLPFGQPRTGHRIEFAEPEPEDIRRIDGQGMLLPEAFATPVNGQTLVLDDRLFEADALIFDHLRSRSLRYGAPTGPQLRFDFHDLPILGVWTKPGADYICIEPWQGINDPAGFDGDIFAKPGIVAIAPGSSRTFTMTITVEP